MVHFSSQAAGNGRNATAAIDGDPRTHWHTQFQPRLLEHPHELVIDLGAKRTIEGFRYLARQDQGWNGAIARCEIYVSDKADEFGKPVAETTFAKIKTSQAVACSKTEGRYVKLKVLSEVNDGPWASVAEFGVVGQLTPRVCETSTICYDERAATPPTATFRRCAIMPEQTEPHSQGHFAGRAAPPDEAGTHDTTGQHTEQQSDSQQRLASELSLQRKHPPAQVRGYDFEAFIGSGAYGEVWVALDRNTGRRVAIKFYTHRAGLDWRLLSREVEKLVLLSADRYIVQVLDVGWDETPPYYAMEFIENGSLDEYLKQHGTLPVDEAVEMFHGVATGLLHAHNKGVLHCDVKPANVLLDQDHRPRLADFGQSRLSNEQSPALGTLFYMAPEQADLSAMPDARWDVYALGVLLYLMLTGEAPYRSQATLDSINSASGLEERLKTYRDAIRSSAPPALHRSVAGVDRALVDIIDRCLAIQPKNRFPNVQSVIDALRARQRSRGRRPLFLLGILGPALLLTVMALFGWRGYDRAVEASDEAVMLRAADSNQFAAQFVASGVSHELERYFRAVELLSQNQDFVSLFQKTVEHEELGPMLAQLRDLDTTDLDDESLTAQRRAQLTSLLALRDEFEQHPARQEMQTFVRGLFQDERKPVVASWVTTDQHGTHVATAFPAPPTRSPIGRNFAWRSYFNGFAQDQPTGWHPQAGQALQRTHLSAVFQSTATNTWKVGISTPVRDADGQFLGIVALTVEMGGFLEGFENSDTRYAVLVDGRDGPYEGVILQHPLFDEILQEHSKLPDRFSEYRVSLADRSDDKVEVTTHYFDPLAEDPAGVNYRQPWIMAEAPVKLRRGPKDESGKPAMQSTGWVVLVQEDYNAAIQPVQDLGHRLFREGLTALAAVFVTIAALWWFVIRGVSSGTGQVFANGPRSTVSSSELGPSGGKSTGQKSGAPK